MRKKRYVPFSHTTRPIESKDRSYLKGLCVLFFLLIVCVACKKDQPPLSQEKFEDILYEFHFSEAYIEREYLSRDTLLKKDLYHTLLSRYNLTKEEFDEALRWYAAHPHIYHQVYKDLTERVDTAISLQKKNREFVPQSTTREGDSIDIWNEENILTSSSLSPFETHRYFIPTDTNFWKGDRFRFSCLPLFVSSKGKELLPEVKVDVYATSGKVFSKSLFLSSGKNAELSVTLPSNMNTKHLLVRFLYPNTFEGFTSLIVKDIHLFRIHTQEEWTSIKKKEEKKQVSLPTDSVKEDSIHTHLDTIAQH